MANTGPTAPEQAPPSSIRQQVAFTALPNGLNGDKHRISVLVSVRLLAANSTVRPLSRWTDFVNWPQTLAERFRAWKVVFPKQGTGTLTARATPVGTTPDPDLWARLFPSDLDVEPFRFENQMNKLNERNIVSYPHRHVHDYLRKKYVSLAQNAEVPVVDGPQGLLETYRDIDLLSEKSENLKVKKELEEIASKFQVRDAIRHSAKGNPAQDFTRMMLFHAPTLKPLNPVAKQRRARRGKRALANTGPVPSFATELDNYFKADRPPAPQPKNLDFHEALTGLGNHPQLLRMLGLVIDLEFSAPAGLGGSAMTTTAVWIEPVWTPTQPNQAAPQLRTRCRIGGGRFEAAPRVPGDNPDADPEIEDGMLRLRSELATDAGKRFRISQIDTDGAGMKTVAFVNDMARSRFDKHRAVGAASRQAPPSFRSAGLSVVRSDRASALAWRLNRQKTLNDAIEKNAVAFVELSREDLTRGFAFDAFDAHSRAWYPLCRRRGSATFVDDPNNLIPLAPEDGWVSTSVTQNTGIGDPNVRLGEQFARWADGWSMVAPRPGVTLGPDELMPDGAPKTTNLNLQVSYQAEPGSLPPQRFGRGYFLRARAVDLAGNVTPFEQADATGFKHALGGPSNGGPPQPEVYRRFEPVPPPVVLGREAATEAESTDVVVIRTNFDLVNNQDTSARHIFPPSIDQVRAELHGMFDTESGVDPGAYETIVKREGRTFDEPNPNAKVDPANKATYLDVDVPLWEVEGGKLARMPGLPDPLARGVGFLGLPGSSGGAVENFSFEGGGWPDVIPWLLEIYESDAPVPPREAQHTDGDGNIVRVLRVGLPKGSQHVVQLSSVPTFDDLNQLGIFGWMDAATQAALTNDILSGKHWAITPSKTLRLVNATRQPLVPTEFTAPRLEKEIGQTHVTISDTMATSRRSTDRFEVRAQWEDVIDYVDPAESDAAKAWQPSRALTGSALVAQKKVLEGEGPDDAIEIAERHDFNHTRHIAAVEYRSVSTTRFADYFFELKFFNFASQGSTVTVDSRGVVDDSETVTSIVEDPPGSGTFVPGTAIFERGVDYEMDYDAGKITPLDDANGNRKTNAQVFVKYLPRPITRESKPATVTGRDSVLSSARPAAPKVLYAVPNFKWERTESAQGIAVFKTQSKRGGGGIRVFLDRPWWSSGAGEELAVVLWPGKDPLPDRARPYVSQRGQDPVFESSPTSQLISYEKFTNGTVTEFGLTLPELPGLKVYAVGHEVKPLTEADGTSNPERRLWYADIALDAGSAYTPFIRFALARYQPNAVRTDAADVKLSPVVLLDFIQMLPDRVASVVNNLFTGSIFVSVSGLTYKSTTAGKQPAMVELTLEQRRPEAPDGDDSVGWMPTPGVAPQVLANPTTNKDGITTWTGSVSTPESQGDRRYRIVIREFERHGKAGSPASRLVYADAIEL